MKIRHLPFFVKIPLNIALIAPFILQVSLAVSLVGYISHTNGQNAVNDLAHQVISKSGSLVSQHLDSYLAVPHQINQLNADAVNTENLNLQNFERTAKYLWRQMHTYKNLAYNSYVLPTGESIGSANYPGSAGITIDLCTPVVNGACKAKSYATDTQGNRTTLHNSYDYNIFEQIWYRDAVKAGKPSWSPINTWDGPVGYVTATASNPIYDNNNQLRAIFSIDLLLSSISDFLRTIHASKRGKIFILERNGLLVANSSSNQPYIVVNEKTARLAAVDSADKTIQATAKFLQQKLGNFEQIKEKQQLEFNFNDTREFVEVIPWRDKFGLDWLVVITVPESDFMTQINNNTRVTIILCLLTLIAASITSIYTSGWIIEPILKLSKASHTIASGNLDQTVSVKGINELETLGESFNYMAMQLKESFTALEQANSELEQKVETRTIELKSTIEELHRTQAQMVQNEKMSALGQMVAGVAHEINNPVNFIHGNLAHVNNYTQELLHLVELYQKYQPNPPIEITEELEEIDFKFLQSDLIKVLESMRIGTNRIREIVISLRNFSRLDEAEMKEVNIHEGIESTLVILNNRLKAKPNKPEILVIKEYGNVPSIECYPGQLNQVFMNILSNAIDALEERDKKRTLEEIEAAPSTMKIVTSSQNNWVKICIIDNGIGISETSLNKLFDPFFTTKEVGKGTGLGLSISYQIITQKHHGKLYCNSILKEGAEFIIEIPIKCSIGVSPVQ